MISFPSFLFADAFGLFRHMYRSLMGLYLIPQFPAHHIRNRRKGLIPLTLGPFGAEQAAILECLLHLNDLDAGMYNYSHRRRGRVGMFARRSDHRRRAVTATFRRLSRANCKHAMPVASNGRPG